MTQIAFADDVLADYPEAEVSFIVATSLDNTSRWGLLEDTIEEIDRELAKDSWAPPNQDDPFIESWHAAYRSFGLNPKRTRPSVEALRRRVVRDRRLPRINSAVDTYNVISLRHELPAGAFDIDAVEGDIVIRRARAGEPFRGIGGDDDTTREGEIVYADARRILTRGWNYRDCDHTKVTLATRTALFMVERISRVVPCEALEDALDELKSLMRGHAQVTARTSLNRHHPKTVLPNTAPAAI